MPRFWKCLVVISLLLNGIALLYLYALIHPNPHNAQFYETAQMKMELRRLKDELDSIKATPSGRPGGMQK